MFYIVSVDGICIIKEIIPTSSDKKYHQNIFEVKSNKCLAFSIGADDQTFYFMDDNKVINMLQRVNGSNQLAEVKILKIKDKERSLLEVDSF